MAAARYKKECLLGTGGMAEVWRAQGPNGKVALKCLLPHAARNASLAAAFEREGTLLGRIRHDNVVGLYEVTRDESGPFLVLEYVEGVDLRILSRAPVSLPLALRTARDVLLALEAVHGLRDASGRPLGIIHRDLSPSNVLVSTAGRVKLTDFGIARALSGSHATTGQSIKGTLGYLSPEQASGAPVDGRADLFAVGALLYQLLTSKPIYDETDPRIALARARAGDVRSVQLGRPDLPPAVAELVDRALAAEPGDRFWTAAVMRGEVERVALLSGELATDADLAAWSRAAYGGSAPGGPFATTVVLPRWTRRRAALAAGAAGALIVALSVAMKWRRAEPIAVAPKATVAAASASSYQAPPSSETPSAPPPPASPAALRSARPASGGAAPGLLDIGSEPGFAYVTIDGVAIGATPIFGYEVRPGRHRIEVQREGLGAKTLSVEVEPGQRIRRVVKLP